MTSRRVRICCLLAFLLVGRVAVSQDVDVMKSRAITALRLAATAGDGAKPFRLTADISLYDGKGKSLTSGSMVFLRHGQDSRLAFDFPETQQVWLYKTAGTYYSGTGTLPPFVLMLVDFMMRPSDRVHFSAAGSIHDRLVEGSPAECMDFIDPSAILTGPKPRPHEVCLDQRDDALHLVNAGDELYYRDEIRPFGGHQIAFDLRLQLGEVTVARLHIKSLEESSDNEEDFRPGAEMRLVATPPSPIPASVMAGKKLSSVNPEYPKVARAAHIQGIVVLQAIIDKTGSISKLLVISSPDQLLTEASMKAVAQWRYEPYLTNGLPTEVETTITIDFSLNGKK